MFYGLFCFFLFFTGLCLYFLWGGHLINLLLSDIPAWCWRFHFIQESWVQRGEEGQTGRSRWEQGKESLSPRLVAETRLCVEPAGVSRRSPWGALEVESWRWSLIPEPQARLSVDCELSLVPHRETHSRAFVWFTCVLEVRGGQPDTLTGGWKGGLRTLPRKTWCVGGLCLGPWEGAGGG